MAGLRDRLTGAVTRVRERLPALDHLVRAFVRYQADAGDRLAAAVTYFGFLSFFPLVALAVSALGFALSGSVDAITQVRSTVNNFSPGLGDQLPLEEIAAARASTGIIGLVGLLYAGLGWVDALRQAIRTVWHQNVSAGNFVVKKLLDATILVGLGLTLAASLVVSGLVSQATPWLLSLVGGEGSAVGRMLVRTLGVSAALVVDTVVFVYLLIRLPRVPTPWYKVVKGAFFAAVGFEALKLAGATYVAHTTSNPIYGTFAVVVGLLVWINLVSRFFLFSAAWTVTAPFDTDVAPSGTSSPEQARKAGLPESFADEDVDGDGAPTLRERGAPSPLQSALRGRPGVGFSDSPPEQADGRDGGERGTGRDGGRDGGERGGPRVPLALRGVIGGVAVVNAVRDKSRRG